MIAFTVLGEPIPQGSARAFMPRGARYPVVTSDNPRTRPWRAMVRDAAQQARGDELPLEDIALELGVLLYLPRPKTAPKRVTEPAKKPDVDKLLRAIMDGITDAGVWRDDAQVVSVHVEKRFAAGVWDPDGAAGVPRAEIEVRMRAEARVRVAVPPAAEQRTLLEPAR